jgi:hypothetical protein
LAIATTFLLLYLQPLEAKAILSNSVATLQPELIATAVTDPYLETAILGSKPISVLLLKLIFDKIEKNSMPFFVRPIARSITSRVKSSFIEPQIAQHLDYMETEIGKNAWVAGNEFTAADIQISFPLEASVARAGLNSSRPKLIAFLNRIHSRPAYQQALKRGGAYSLLS